VKEEEKGTATYRYSDASAYRIKLCNFSLTFLNFVNILTSTVWRWYKAPQVVKLEALGAREWLAVPRPRKAAYHPCFYSKTRSGLA
jgi:hypothetical protein